MNGALDPRIHGDRRFDGIGKGFRPRLRRPHQKCSHGRPQKNAKTYRSHIAPQPESTVDSNSKPQNTHSLNKTLLGFQLQTMRTDRRVSHFGRGFAVFCRVLPVCNSCMMVAPAPVVGSWMALSCRLSLA